MLLVAVFLLVRGLLILAVEMEDAVVFLTADLAPVSFLAVDDFNPTSLHRSLQVPILTMNIPPAGLLTPISGVVTGLLHPEMYKFCVYLGPSFSPLLFFPSHFLSTHTPPPFPIYARINCIGCVLVQWPEAL